MTKKILLFVFSTALLFNLNIEAGFAQANPASPPPQSAALTQCINTCKETNPDDQALTLKCTNQCQDQLNRTEYLPPIVKPNLLPGPNFSNNLQRTGDEATAFVTERLMPKIATRLISIVAIASMLGIIYAGIIYLTAFGDPEKSTKGKNAAIYAVIGLVIAILSFTIVQIISSIPLN